MFYLCNNCIKRNQIEYIMFEKLEKKYGKFWDSKKPSLENAKRILKNYCERDLLLKYPALAKFPINVARIGKNRTKEFVKLVSDVLNDSSITDVETLIKRINGEGKYSKNSSLGGRIEFICHKAGIPYTRDDELIKNYFFISLDKEPTHIITSPPTSARQILNKLQQTPKAPSLEKSITSERKMAPSAKTDIPLSDIYPLYYLGEEFTVPSERKREDKEFGATEVFTSFDKLIPEEDYMYVINQDGRIFISQHIIDRVNKLTHSALLRKSMDIKEEDATPPVLAAGHVEIDELGRLYFNLASGHFKPSDQAYEILLQTVISGSPAVSKNIYFNAYSIKSIDPRSSHRPNTEMGKKLHDFRCAIYNYVKNNDTRGLKPAGYNVAMIFLENFRNPMVDTKPLYSEKSLKDVFDNDKEFYTILVDNKDCCHDSIVKFIEDQTPETSMKP